MCKHFKTTFDDPIIVDMDPVQKLVMQYQWLADREEYFENVKNEAILTGMFFNPEMAKKMMGDGEIKTTDEEFEETMNFVKEYSDFEKEQERAKIKHRRKRKLK